MGGVDIKISARTYAQRLKAELGDEYITETAFLYSDKSTYNKLKRLADQGADDITVVSLFPHPCICTHGRIREHIEKARASNPTIKISFIENLCESDLFTTFWSDRITKHIAEHNLEKPFLLFSAHSIPQVYADRGDKYSEFVIDSATKIADSLGLEFDVGFQSRLGKAKWLSPETQDLLEIYKNEQQIVMVPISFVSENLETKFDIDTEFIPFAQNDLKVKNITRVRIPIEDETLLNCIKEAVINND